MGKAAKTTPGRQLPSSPRLEAVPGSHPGLAQMEAGLDIALAYFNAGGNEELPELTQRAKTWADKYFGAYRYASKRSASSLGQFAHMVLAKSNIDMASPAGTTSCVGRVRPSTAGIMPVYDRDLLRAERRVQNSEPFPDFIEPTLLSDQEIDQVVARRTQHGRQEARSVDAAALRDSGLLHFLPGFLAQLACVSVDDKSALRGGSHTSGDDEEEKASAFVVEGQRLRHARRVILPGGGPLKMPDFHDDSEELLDIFSQVPRTSLMRKCKRNTIDDNSSESGNETDGSTSTMASRRVNLRKRKAIYISSTESNQQTTAARSHQEARPNKIRCNAYYPPPTLTAFDTAKGHMVSRFNPAVKPEDGPDPWEELSHQRKKMEQDKRMHGSGSGSVASSSADVEDGDDEAADDEDEQSDKGGGWPCPSPAVSAVSNTSRIIRIKIPKPGHGRHTNPANGSMKPTFKDTTPSRVVITLRDPRSASPRPTDRRSAGLNVSTVIKLRVSPSPHSTATAAPAARPSSSSCNITGPCSTPYRPSAIQEPTPPLSEASESGPASPASLLPSPVDSIMGDGSLSSMSSVSIGSSYGDGYPAGASGGGGNIYTAGAPAPQQMQAAITTTTTGRARRVRIKLVKRPSPSPSTEMRDTASLKKQPKRAIEEVEGASEREGEGGGQRVRRRVK